MWQRLEVKEQRVEVAGLAATQETPRVGTVVSRQLPVTRVVVAEVHQTFDRGARHSRIGLLSARVAGVEARQPRLPVSTVGTVVRQRAASRTLVGLGRPNPTSAPRNPERRCADRYCDQ